MTTSISLSTSVAETSWDLERASGRIGWQRLGYFLAIGLQLAIILCHATGDIYGDEEHTLTLASQPNFLDQLRSPVMAHPPLYFVLARACYQLFSEPWAIRIPSMLFGLATVALIPIVARRVLGHAAFLPAALVAGLSPYIAEFSAEGRPYALLIFLSVAFVGALVNFVRHEDWGNAAILTTVALLGVYTHYFFALNLICGAVYYLVTTRHVSWKAATAAAVVFAGGLLLIPLLSSTAGHVSGTQPVGALRMGNFLARWPVAITFGYCTFSLPHLDAARNVDPSVWRENWLTLIVVTVCFASLSIGWYLFFRSSRGLAISLTWLCAGPVALAVVAGVMGVVLLREKYLSIVYGSYVLLLIACLTTMSRYRPLWPGLAAYGALCLLSIFHYTVLADEYSRRDNWTALRARLDAKVTADDYVLSHRKQVSDSRRIEVGVPSDHFIDLAKDRSLEQSITHLVEQIGQRCRGKIFLISHAGARNAFDTGDEAMTVLTRQRRYTATRYGRNLTLYEFDRLE